MIVPQADPKANYLAHREEIDAAVMRVLNAGAYILGEETRLFEQEFASYIGQRYAVGVASGTDALFLALRACDIGASHEVITVAHTAVATIAAICMAGATPVCVDIDPQSRTLDPNLLEAALTPHTRAIVPVHLYGQPAAMQSICEFAEQHGLWVIEDCAQAHGAVYQGRKIGAWGQLAAFSFYPTKNLGALGDGGAILCSDSNLYERLKALRQYGWDEGRISQSAGVNSRLDELQAAVLRVKLRHLDDDNAQRRNLAARYMELLAPVGIALPKQDADSIPVFHLYVIQHALRDLLRAFLARRSIGTAIHYPLPAHLQPGYRDRIRVAGSLANTEYAAQSVLSLPLYPELRPESVEQVAAAIREWLADQPT